jgi:hypothetical protein
VSVAFPATEKIRSREIGSWRREPNSFLQSGCSSLWLRVRRAGPWNHRLRPARPYPRRTPDEVGEQRQALAAGGEEFRLSVAQPQIAKGEQPQSGHQRIQLYHNDLTRELTLVCVPRITLYIRRLVRPPWGARFERNDGPPRMMANGTRAHPNPPGKSVDEFDYFMIRVRRPRGGVAEQTLSGVVECLGTGEKQAFASSEELLRFVSGEPNRRINVQFAARTDNTKVS